MTGPTILFDKSFLQSLSVDESVIFDHFFISVITPVFYMESLADLAKDVRQGRTLEQEVEIIEQKTPEMSGVPCAYHTEMCIANLMGDSIPLDGRIPLVGGRAVKVDEHRGWSSMNVQRLKHSEDGNLAISWKSKENLPENGGTLFVQWTCCLWLQA